MLIEKITEEDIKKIFTVPLKKEYLKRMIDIKHLNIKLPSDSHLINVHIIDTWDYETSKNIIRKMFFESEKYSNGINSQTRINDLIKEWKELNLGDLEWPFGAMNFDQHVATINRKNCSEKEKDNIITNEIIKFRRIKDINTKRNDYIESLIVKYNDNVIPTLKHSKNVDFYINGIEFDQKVSRSVGHSFIEEYGDDYYNIALSQPILVATSLYENQDKERFDNNSRLYIVYLDNDVSSEKVESSIKQITFKETLDIKFDYSDNSYESTCYIILLHN